MSFLFPAFLFGALAIAVPVVLHLLRRDLAPEVAFTAVRLLRKSPMERSRKRRLRDLLLLAARIVALLLLALAFARPYLRGAAATSGPLHIVAIDRSYSMDAPGRFERALELARRAIDQARGPVAVVSFDDRAGVLAQPGTAADARAALAGLRPGYGGTNYSAAAAKAVALAGDRRSSLVLITDLQRSGWQDGERPSIPATLDVVVRDVGVQPPNLAVSKVRIQSDGLLVSIDNEGPAPRAGRVRIERGRTIAEARFTAPVGSTVDIPVTLRVPTTGSATVAIDDPDGLVADNTRYILLGAMPPREVLLVASAGTGGFYLSRALEAAATGESGSQAVTVRVISGPALGAIQPDNAARLAAIVLLSTRGIDKRGRDQVAQAVRRGAGLLVSAGPEVEPSLLSAIFEWQPALDAHEDARAVTLSATDLRHPIFRLFEGFAGNLGQVRFDRTWRVKMPGWDVAARFTDGSPALLERAEGQGRVVLFASDLERRWNDFPLHPAFVPFAAETVRYISTRAERPREYVVAAAPSVAAGKSGVYRLPHEEGDLVVNVDPRESAGARLTASEFNAMFDRAASSPLTDPLAEARQAEAGQSYWRYGLLLMIAALVTESFVGRA